MNPANEDRRKKDQERWEKISMFMARIDQRNIDKDLNYAIQGDLVMDHECRITSLEHSRTQYNTGAKILTGTGFLTMMVKKFGHYF